MHFQKSRWTLQNSFMVFYWYSIISHASGVNFLTMPQNTTFDLGSSFMLSCSADNQTNMDWSRGEGYNRQLIFATVDGKSAPFSTDFGWMRPNNTTVIMVVNNATSKYADMYCCQLTSGVWQKACAYVMENPQVLTSSEPVPADVATKSTSRSGRNQAFYLGIGFVVLLNIATLQSFHC